MSSLNEIGAPAEIGEIIPLKQVVAAAIAGVEYAYRPQVFAIIEAAIFYSDPLEIEVMLNLVEIG